jgi:hypothetical protein
MPITPATIHRFRRKRLILPHSWPCRHPP